MKIAILGGTGQQGPGLALRWAMAGEEVIIGSRSQERAEKTASELNAELGDAPVRGMENGQAAAAAEIVVLTVPYPAHLSTLASVKTQVQGKIFVDVSVPLDPENPRRMKMPPAGSATEEAQAFLGPATRVVAASKPSPPVRCAILTMPSTAMSWCAVMMRTRRRPSCTSWPRWACTPTTSDRPKTHAWWRD